MIKAAEASEAAVENRPKTGRWSCQEGATLDAGLAMSDAFGPTLPLRRQRSLGAGRIHTWLDGSA